MPTLLLHKESSSQQQLQRLVQIRWFYIVVQFLAIVATSHLLGSLPYYFQMLIIIAVEVTINLYGMYQMQHTARLTETKIWLHLLFDITAITGLLYFNGGATSGFVSVLLLPVTLTALLCSYRRAIISAFIAISSYSLMMKYYAPVNVSTHHHMMGDAMQTHYMGMWLTFTVSTLLLVYFISRLSELLSRQQLEISQQQEQQLIDEHIIELAISSANAAHQLSTPLNSMQLAVEELKDSTVDPVLTECIDDQLSRCKHILSQIRSNAEKSKKNTQQSIATNELLEKLQQHWLINFPAISLDITFLDNSSFQKSSSMSALQTSVLKYERGLIPALINLLDNAVKNHQSSVTESISIELHQEPSFLFITLRNQSSEINSELLSQLGKQPINSSNGMGIGFLLANSTIERLGGKVWLTPLESNTIETQITIPIIHAEHS